MNDAATLETYEPLTTEQLVVEQAPVSTKPTLPAAPFPRKYVHSVFVDLQDARLVSKNGTSTSCRAAILWKRWHRSSRLSTS